MACVCKDPARLRLWSIWGNTYTRLSRYRRRSFDLASGGFKTFGASPMSNVKVKDEPADQPPEPDRHLIRQKEHFTRGGPKLRNRDRCGDDRDGADTIEEDWGKRKWR